MILLLAMLSALGPLSIDMYLPALPHLAESLDMHGVSAEATLAAFFVGIGVGQLFYGPLSDRYGRKPLLIAGLGLYTGATLLCALANDGTLLVLARLLEGLGGAAGGVLARAVVRDVYEGDRVARVLSLMIMAIAVAPLIAPILGGKLLEPVGWRGIFLVLAAFGVLCLGIILWKLPETLPQRAHPGSLVGEALRSYGYLLGDRRVRWLMLANGGAMGAMFAYVAGSPFLYIDWFGVAPESFGYLFAINVLGFLGLNALNARLVVVYGAVRMMRLGAVYVLAGGLCLMATGFADAGIPGFVAALLFAISGVGVIMTNASALLLNLYPERAGSASAVLGLGQFGIGALAALAVDWLAWGPTIDMPLVMGLSLVMAFVAVMWLTSRHGGELVSQHP